MGNTLSFFLGNAGPVSPGFRLAIILEMLLKADCHGPSQQGYHLWPFLSSTHGHQCSINAASCARLQATVTWQPGLPELLASVLLPLGLPLFFYLRESRPEGKLSPPLLRVTLIQWRKAAPSHLHGVHAVPAHSLLHCRPSS